MLARSSILGTLSLMLLPLPPNPGSFTLAASGAVTMAITGEEAQYGVTRGDEGPMIVVTMGATTAPGSLMLFVPGDRLPTKGRYSVHSTWDGISSEEIPFHACFGAGLPERPIGWFHGESGWVTITGSGEGWISGEFEIRARGFLGANSDDENRWVTVRGSFDAHGDSSVAVIASLQ